MITLNALSGVRAVVTMTKTGGWSADVDVNLEAVPVVPSGPAALTIGTNLLNGTIDDRATGRFGSKAKVRLVGGAGWDKVAPALQEHNDAGVFSTEIYAVTAASVGEPPVVELGPPRRLGADYARMRGTASQVFAGVDWWVDVLGITHVGPRIPLPLPPTADILEWDPTAQVAVIASDILVMPGMTLVDPLRFGTVVVDDVEHTFSDEGARAIAWCSSPSVADVAAVALKAPPASAGAKLVQALAAHARMAAGSATLKKYSYRVVAMGPDGRINLQSTDPLAECPLFLKMISVWGGIPGLKVKLAPTATVLVSFIDGDRARPIIEGFDPSGPPAIEIKVDGLRIVLGSVGADPIAKATETAASLTALGTALASVALALTGIDTFPAIAALPTAHNPIVAAVAAIGTAETALATDVPLIPSTKAFTD